MSPFESLRRRISLRPVTLRRPGRSRRRWQSRTTSAVLQQLEPRTLLSGTGALYFSMSAPVELTGVGEVSPADIVRYDLQSADGMPQYELYFDGDALGLSGADVDALAILSDTQLLLSFSSSLEVPGVGTVQSSDIVMFTAENPGDCSSGTFSLLLEGRRAGLNVSASYPQANIDAISVLENGHLVVSIAGNATLPGENGNLSITDADLLELTPAADGSLADGTWSLFFDGSDVGLTFSSEGVDGVDINADGRIFVSTRGSFFVNRPNGGTGFGGSNTDVVEFEAASLGETTTGGFLGLPVLFDGNVRDAALAPQNLNAIHLDFREPVAAVNSAPTADSQALSVDEDGALAVTLTGDDGDADVAQALTFVIVDGPEHGTLVDFDPLTGTATYVPDADFNGDDHFTFRVEDDLSIDGTPLSSETAAVTLSVLAVNDTPSVDAPAEEQVGNEDQELVIKGVSVDDVDVKKGNGHLAVKLKIKSGTLKISTAHLGSDKIEGNGTHSVVLTGTAEELNSTLAEGITYLGDPDFCGTCSLEVTIDDLGNTGAGGPLASSVAVPIRVRSVADQVEELRGTIAGLVESGALSNKSASALYRKLRKIDSDSPPSAKRVNAFLKKTASQEYSKRIDPAVADLLRDATESILLSLLSVTLP